MPIGILTEEQFNTEVNRFNKVLDRESGEQSEILQTPQILEIGRGRGEGTKEVPMEIRKVIAQELIAGAPSKLVQQSFGVSPASAAAYKNGATSTSTYHEKNEELQKSNDEFRDKVKNLAADRLVAALESITAEKLMEARLTDAASVAKDMSGIIKNVTPEQNQIVNNNQVVIFRPRMSEEEEYEIIDIQNKE